MVAALKTWADWREEPGSDLAPETRRHERHQCVVAVHRGLLIDLALRCGETCSAFSAEVLLDACMGELLGLPPDVPYVTPKGRFKRTVLHWAQAKVGARPGGKLPGAYLHLGDEDVLSNTLMFQLPGDMVLAQVAVEVTLAQNRIIALELAASISQSAQTVSQRWATRPCPGPGPCTSTRRAPAGHRPWRVTTPATSGGTTQRHC